MAVDRYATRHCPVLMYTPDGNIRHFASISKAAKATGLSVQKVKRLVHYPEADEEGREFDIPAYCAWITVAEISPDGGIRVRLIKKARIPKFETIFREGKMKIIPRADYVLLEKKETEEKTQSGLYIPTKQNESVAMGYVVETGSDVSEVNKGNKVLYPTMDATEVKADEKVLYLIPASSIYAILEE